MKNRVKYTIQMLDSETFSKLPYKYTSQAVGITDTNEKKIFIRNMGNVKLNNTIIEHEVDEASLPFSHDEPSDEKGIRYGFGKWFKKTFIPESKSSIGSVIGTGLGLLAAPFTGGTSLAFLNPATLGTVGGAVGGYKEGGGLKSTALGALKGFGVGSIGSGIQAAATGAKTGLGNISEFIGGATAPTKKLLSGIGKFLTPGAAGAGAGAGSAGAGVGSTLLPGSPFGGGIPSLTQAGTTAARLGSNIGAGLQTAGRVASTASKINWPMTIAGFGLPLAAQGLIKTPGIPESADVNRLRGLMEEGGTAISPIGTLGLEKLTGRLGAEYSGLPEDLKTAIKAEYEQPYEDAKRNLTAQYKALRPNADISNDSAYRRDMARLEKEFADQISNRMAQMEFQYHQDYLTRQSEDMRLALGLDEQTFNRYAELAQLDLDKLMLQYGLDYQTAKDFKDIFGQVGSLIMQRGLGLQSPFAQFSLS